MRARVWIRKTRAGASTIADVAKFLRSTHNVEARSERVPRAFESCIGQTSVEVWHHARLPAQAWAKIQGDRISASRPRDMKIVGLWPGSSITANGRIDSPRLLLVVDSPGRGRLSSEHGTERRLLTLRRQSRWILAAGYLQPAVVDAKSHARTVVPTVNHIRSY